MIFYKLYIDSSQIPFTFCQSNYKNVFSNIFKYFFQIFFFEQLFDVKRSFNICIAAAAHCRWKFKGVSETPIWFGRLKTKQEKNEYSDFS